VVADPATGRYRLLFTVRSFLLDALRAQSGLADAEERFLERCLALAQNLEQRFQGPDEPAADRQLRDELDNLRAARDLAMACGRHDVSVGITVALDEASGWRDLRELWAWALELAADPRITDHPRRVEVLGSAAEAARLMGDLDLAGRLADEGIALAGADPDPAQVYRAWRARGSVAHFRGDFAAACEGWLRAEQGRPMRSGWLLASAALAAAYGGDPARARELLDQTHGLLTQARCDSQAALAAYVEGELRASVLAEDPVPFYLEAIAGARRAGATYIEGVASVSLASARTRMGDVAGAADGFVYLIDYWRRTGQATQLWTTARNAASLLSSVDRSRTAALLLLAADSEPGAAAVGPEIAWFSGRAFTAVGEIVEDEELAALSAEAVRLGGDAILDDAVAELRTLAEVKASAEP